MSWFNPFPAASLAGVLLTASLLAGCGSKPSGPERYDVSGTITFEGQPVPYGSIQFMPDEKKGNFGPIGYALILDGAYSTAKGGVGIVGGPHQILVTGMKAAPEERQNTDSPTMDLSLFPEYRTDSNLQKSSSTLDLEIPRPTR